MFRMSTLGRKIREYVVAECGCSCQSGIVLVNLMTRNNRSRGGQWCVLFIVRALPAVVAWENRPWSWLQFKAPPLD